MASTLRSMKPKRSNTDAPWWPPPAAPPSAFHCAPPEATEAAAAAARAEMSPGCELEGQAWGACGCMWWE
eukprot:1133644-Pelagomonas_calceolata.AAC.6